MAISKSYTAKDIEVLEGLAPVRKRPGMYIGGTDETAYHHLANEILDNSIDEAVAGYAKEIAVKLVNKNTITVSDDGRGIPIDKHPKKKKTALEVVMSTLHSGGKFNDSIYKSSAGLHGVGLSVVNALSSKLNIQVTKNSKIYSQDYSKGKILNKLKAKGKNKIKNGTLITFSPDPEIFGKDISFKPDKIYELSKNKAYLQRGIKIYWECNKGEKLQVVLGKDLFIKGFDKQILGSKKNEEKIAIVNLPDNYPKKELAGKKTKFKCKILNIKKPSEQKIDDAFAKNMGAKDLKDLESMIEKQISREFENITNQLLNKEILDILDKEYKLDLPKGMLENEMKSVEHTLIHEKMREKGEKDHSKIKLDEKDKKELKKISERRVKLALVLTHIADENSIKVSPQELQTELEKQLKMYPGQEKTIKEYYQKNPGELTKLKGPLFEEKVINFIKDKAKLKIKQIKKEDLEKLMKQDQPIKAKDKKKVKSSSKTKKASSAKKSRKK